jgi:hypothetical protein
MVTFTHAYKDSQNCQTMDYDRLRFYAASLGRRSGNPRVPGPGILFVGGEAFGGGKPPHSKDVSEEPLRLERRSLGSVTFPNY